MRDVVLSLFDYTGQMVTPWVSAGFDAVIVDNQHKNQTNSGKISRLNVDLSKPWLPPRWICDRVCFVSAFPPCDHLAVSGARWFKGKGLRSLSQSVAMFATAAEVCEWLDVPYMIENPVSTMATYWRKPDYIFHPYEFTDYCPDDNYTKKTCLWTGNGFVMPQSAVDDGLAEPDDRIHKAAPGPDRSNFRSATPPGFAQAVFHANAPTLVQKEAS